MKESAEKTANRNHTESGLCLRLDGFIRDLRAFAVKLFYMYKPLAVIPLLFITLSAFAAPELSDADRQRLADGTTDKDTQLDQQPGLYVLLQNAQTWQGDDFSGDAGAKVAPEPDYEFIRSNPDKARGNVYLIEGWLAQADRYPNPDAGLGREKLYNQIDPAWGEQVTRWTIATARGDASSTIIVLFNDPRGQMSKPAKDAKVRVAARFYKLWTIKAANGKPFTYAVFVGGAAETVPDAASSSTGGGTSNTSIMLLALVAILGAFFVIRYLLNRGGGGTQMSERLEAIRRERERYEAEEQEMEPDDQDLPDDPAAALDTLRDRHEEK